MVRDKENHLKNAMQRNLSEKHGKIVNLEKSLSDAKKELEAKQLKLSHFVFEYETLAKEISDVWVASNCLGSTWGS